MTPLIKKISSLVNSHEHDFVWFDVGKTTKSYDSFFDEILVNLPFRSVAICGHSADGSDFLIAAIEHEKNVAVFGYGFLDDGRRHTKLPAFAYGMHDGALRVYRIDGESPPTEETYGPVLDVIYHFLSALASGCTGYKSVPRKTPTNARRAAKGKPPLSVDWHTVTIEPVRAPESSAHCGTHASPRKHQRRGHWRNHPNGNRVWVRDCWVGDATKGTVFKDYKIGGEPC